MRPLKYGEKLISVPTRVPESAMKEFNLLVREFLKKYEVVNDAKNDAVIEAVKVTETTKPKWQIDAEERMKRNKV